MKLHEIVSFFAETAPFSLQESYDNSGIQTGNPQMELTSALICLDVTEDIIDEAIQNNQNLIVSHHPVIFNGIKSLSGNSITERILIKAIKNDIAILSIHTNFDSIFNGVNNKICDKLGLINRQILVPAGGKLAKLVTFIPEEHAEIVRSNIFKAGAGMIGEYDNCSFNLSGEGTFRAGQNTDPFVGEKGKLHTEKEIRLETIFPLHLKKKVILALLKSHPYEEVAYDIYPLLNDYPKAGMGMVGQFEEPLEEYDFLNAVKMIFNSGCVRYTALKSKKISKVAVCGGSGSFLLKDAIAVGADAFISADFKYHQFFDADGKILVADIGHYESEQFTKELFYELLMKKFPKFAFRLSEVNTNPINYL
jgi:dinuclear metal center YbgI/SA1388 family protein